MDLRAVWNDDMSAFIAFLVVILPLPFAYVILDNMFPGRAASRLSIEAFLATGLLWMAVGVLYYVFSVKGSSDSEREPGRV